MEKKFTETPLLFKVIFIDSYFVTCQHIGGWQPNLWNNFPQFKFEYQRIIPEPPRQLEEKIIDREKMARQKYMKDHVNSLYKKKETLPQ